MCQAFTHISTTGKAFHVWSKCSIGTTAKVLNRDDEYAAQFGMTDDEYAAALVRADEYARSAAG